VVVVITCTDSTAVGVVNTTPFTFTDTAPFVSHTRIAGPPDVVLVGVAVNEMICTEVITVSVVLAVTVPTALVAVIV
jgi:hypothetical protein